MRVVKLPWAEPSSRFTTLFERLAIDWLRAASQQAVAEQLQLSWEIQAHKLGQWQAARRQVYEIG